MTALPALAQKVVEWAVIAALVGVVGYLIGNSDAAKMRAEIDALRADHNRLEGQVKDLSADFKPLPSRVLTLEVQAQSERDMKGDAK